MKNILVPTDFSPSAGNALNCAILLAKEVGAKIFLLNVVPMPDFSTGIAFDEGVIEEISTDMENLLKEKEKYIYEIAPEVITESFTAMGFAWSEILSIAQNKNIDLIVMGKHGTGSLNKILGSTAGEVVNKAGCAVLVVPDEIIHYPFKKIAFATDFDDSEIASIKMANSWSEKSKTTLNLVHISEAKISNGVKNRTPEQFAHKLMADYGLQHLKIESKIATNPTSGLTEYVLNENIDLLVLAHKKRTFISQISHPSISKQMTFKLHCSILALPLVNSSVKQESNAIKETVKHD